MSTKPNSLAALLRAVERLQTSCVGSDTEEACDHCYAAGIELPTFDITALRAASHQHAEALREWASSDNLPQSHLLRAAANFLDGKAE